MTDTNVSSLVLKKGSNRYIFDPSGNLDLSNYYTKSEADGKYALKTDLNKYSLTTHTHSQYATTTAVTNAQNTANNALNAANSITAFSKFTMSSASIVLTNNLFVKTENPYIGNHLSLAVDGFTMNTISYYAGEGQSREYVYGLVAKGKTLTKVGTDLASGSMLGEYLH